MGWSMSEAPGLSPEVGNADLKRRLRDIYVAAFSGRTEQRERADEIAGDFRQFVQAAWPILEPVSPFIPGWHIDAICAHLLAVSNG